MFKIPEQWQRVGLVLSHAQVGQNTQVVGDPCVVWDAEESVWRMFLFIQPTGHGQAVYQTDSATGKAQWHYRGALTFTNPHALIGGTTHKPFVVMDAYRPNQPARIDGRYGLVTVSFDNSHKVVQQAWSDRLAGPWTVDEHLLIDRGQAGAFDEKHVDAVSAYYFASRKEILYFYMGYPYERQPFALSPYGSALGSAIQKVDTGYTTKVGLALEPSGRLGHWGSGYVGGMQLFPGRDHKWIGLVNASPTPPHPNDMSPWREEPPPSLAGFVYCDEEIPTHHWHWYEHPIEQIDEIPDYALAWGERTNFWRQHIWIQLDGRALLLYNSGLYGSEQLFAKVSDVAFQIHDTIAMELP
ncbi:MAG: hypothetical protein SF123_12290 [Chloroflexota bacterium]|nr:hypothetical protein [Chloroflexota bacterium]